MSNASSVGLGLPGIRGNIKVRKPKFKLDKGTLGSNPLRVGESGLGVTECVIHRVSDTRQSRCLFWRSTPRTPIGCASIDQSDSTDVATLKAPAVVAAIASSAHFDCRDAETGSLIACGVAGDCSGPRHDSHNRTLVVWA